MPLPFLDISEVAFAFFSMLLSLPGSVLGKNTTPYMACFTTFFSHLADEFPIDLQGLWGETCQFPVAATLGDGRSIAQASWWGGCNGVARSGEVLRTTSRQLMNQVASLPLHVAFKHIFILLQLNSCSLGCIQDC